ncbi:F-box domain-containing protein [Mycena sanguinolenta]|uniref:F-box domain-containing protein n=1 Tax=Mycena sanguinolenta TaxID=230812 RepID=A0A8H7CPQ0_9AGAR|nr:F-box domain-containing protein [Mycena sanguinolenta]
MAEVELGTEKSMINSVCYTDILETIQISKSHILELSSSSFTSEKRTFIEPHNATLAPNPALHHSVQSIMSRCPECGSFVLQKPDPFELNIPIAPQTLARISRLWTTNDPAQEPELALIRPVAKKAAARLACLDSEIFRLRDHLRDLEEEHAALAEYHAKNSTILSPMRRIPSEILGEIFSWSLLLSSAPDVKASPWVLTHVSRRWRAVAVTKFSLWSYIFLDFSCRRTYSLDMVRTQIQRASTLNISFYGSRDSDSHPQINMLQLLLERSSIWEELRLQLIPALIPLITASRGRLPLLRRAWVQWNGPESQVAVESVDFFRIAPSLTDITVISEHRFVPTVLPIHHRLTRYDLDAPWATHYELLKSLPNLREVRITRDFDLPLAWPEPGEPIRLLQLRRLYVSRIECLAYLTAPALESLVIHSHGGDETRSHLHPFVMRSSCRLRRLCMSGLPDPQDVGDILQQQPSITEVAIMVRDEETQDEDTERDALTALFTRFTITNSTAILPHICELHFGCRNAEAIYYPLYLDMVDSRWNADSCALKAAELVLPNTESHPDPESLMRIETLRQAGMQIVLLSGTIAQDRADQWFLIPPRA